MKKSATEYLFIEIKALFFVILLYLIIAQVFIFSFPLKHVSNKPIFVFWGSFFDPFNSKTGSEKNRQDKLNLKNISVPTELSQHKMKSVDKPNINIQQYTKENKTIIKNTFLTQNPSHNDGQTVVNNTDLDSTKVKYQPISLNKYFMQ